MKRKNKLTLDSLLRSTPALRRIPLIVLCEPAIKSILNINHSPVHFNLAIEAAHAFIANPKDQTNLQKIFDNIKKAPQKDHEIASRIISKLLVDFLATLSKKEFERTSQIMSTKLRKPSPIRTEMDKLLQSRAKGKLKRSDGKQMLELAHDTIGVPRDGNSKIIISHEDRNGKVEKIEVLPKQTYVNMRRALFNSRQKKTNLFISIAVAISLVTLVISTRIYFSPNTPTKAEAVKKQTYTWEEVKKVFQNQISLNLKNPSIGNAVRKAIAKHSGSFSYNQVFDVYDYVVKEVKNSNTSHGILPRDPQMTLTGLGDCRAKSLLLATMLEYLGAQTAIVWLPPTEGSSGHMHVALKISNYSSGIILDQETDGAKELLVKRYGKKARNPGLIDFGKGNLPGMYLVLDSTFPSSRYAAPGQFPTDNVYGEPVPFDSRPEVRGRLPKIN